MYSIVLLATLTAGEGTMSCPCVGGPCCGYAWPGCGYAYGVATPSWGVMPPAPSVPPARPRISPKELFQKKPQVKTFDRARFVFRVPAGAKLYVEGQRIDWKDPTVVFMTPLLENGKTYAYQIRAEVLRDGKPVVETRDVVFRPGTLNTTDFRSLERARGVASAKMP